jgi:hypothetical protein
MSIFQNVSTLSDRRLKYAYDVTAPNSCRYTLVSTLSNEIRCTQERIHIQLWNALVLFLRRLAYSDRLGIGLERRK